MSEHLFSNEQVRRALSALREARLGTRGPIPAQAVRKALEAALAPPSEEEMAEEIRRRVGCSAGIAIYAAEGISALLRRGPR